MSVASRGRRKDETEKKILETQKEAAKLWENNNVEGNTKEMVTRVSENDKAEGKEWVKYGDGDE